MSRNFGKSVLLVLGLTPIAVFSLQQAGSQVPTSDQVFKNIKVFKGVPASDLIPAMEFMSASMKYQCSDCHDPKDYAAETRAKETARNMVLLQRDINTKHFNGKLEVTCMTCHNGNEHPVAAPIPGDAKLRHDRFDGAPKPEDVFAKHIASVGKPPVSITRSGTLTAPNDATHKIETSPLEFTQAEGGKFRLTSGDRKVVSNGAEIWYGTMPMTDEPAAIFGRIGRAWGESAFSGLERTTVSGKNSIGKVSAIVVRGVRPATSSTEELYFDAKTGLLIRMVNIRRSTIGSVISMIDYANYKAVGTHKVPMRITVTFAGSEQWILDLKSAKSSSQVGSFAPDQQ